MSLTTRSASDPATATLGTRWRDRPLDSPRRFAGSEVVYHAVQPVYTRWPEDFPALNDSIIDASAAVGARPGMT